jgi:lipopolysaccharide heptosyltransferase II
MGDIILTTPLIRAVRKHYPQAQIDFIIKQQFLDLIRTNPHLSHVILFDKNRNFNGLKALKTSIQQQRYDVLIDIHKNFRSVYLRTGSHATYVTKYSKQIFRRTLLVWFGINWYKEIKPVYKRYFEAVEAFGIHGDGLGTEVIVPEEETAKTKTFLKKDGYNADKSLIVICPGASFANKRWKSEGFAAVADYLARKENTFIVLLGGKQDIAICENVWKLMAHRAMNYAGQFTLLEAASLLKESSLVLTNDSGLMHLAQAQKRPVVAIFGPTTRELGYFPMPEQSVVVEHDVSCRPCTHNGLDKCPKKHFKCMNEISSDQVIVVVDQLLH